MNYLLGAMCGLGALLIVLAGLLSGASILFSGQDVPSLVILGVTFGITALVTFALTVGYLVTGRSVAAGRGRILQTVFAVLALGNIPLGTLYGAYAIWVCWMNEETRAAFDDPYR